jgi:hypothetical protein
VFFTRSTKFPLARFTTVSSDAFGSPIHAPFDRELAAATLMLDGGADIRYVQEMLGHTRHDDDLHPGVGRQAQEDPRRDAPGGEAETTSGGRGLECEL